MGRIGGIALSAQRGRSYFSDIRQSRPQAAMRVYADNADAARLRAIDIRRKAGMTPTEWARLMRSREHTFGLPPGSLK